MREVKFQSVHQSHTNDKDFRFLEWGSKDPGAFQSPSSLSGYKLIGHREFTGLKDKNGNDIYEGDIIRLDKKSVYEVEWSEQRAGWYLIHAKRYGDDWGVYTRNIYLEKDEKEVIGNIFENQNLLSK